jgi:diguanylate cyclase (GGDEF)-like protein
MTCFFAVWGLRLQMARRLADLQFMVEDAEPEAEHHVSGLLLTNFTEVLADNLPANAVRNLLLRAGETRSLDEIGAYSSWSSYSQLRRLLEEAAVAWDSSSSTDGGNLSSSYIGQSFLDSELAGIIHGLGSPAAVLAASEATNPLLPIRRYELTEVNPTEWTIHEWFIEGFAPYPEFCEFQAGQYELIPAAFGLERAEVTEEACQCRGDPSCLFRLRWEDKNDLIARLSYSEMHSRHIENQLEHLKVMVADLASNERNEDILQGIVGSSLQAVGAGGALMALEARPGCPRTIYSEGLTDGEATSIAENLLEGRAGHEGVVVAEIVSARRHYGFLAIGELGGLFPSQSQGPLETYAGLAAAALDSADALEDARHQASSAKALLHLSKSLATIVSTDEMAAKVAQAVPHVIDCDRVAVFLSDIDSAGTIGGFKLAASFGYPDDLLTVIESKVYRAPNPDSVFEYGIVRTLTSEVGNVASVSAPITVGGVDIGSIVAGVTTDPERLAITPRLADQLAGLAAQAGIAVDNARLVDAIRFQAVHDPLTGLPNRALILDRTEQMLSRGRRTAQPVAALFIDLDGFKNINDTLGHGVGDQVLRAVTERLCMTVRESDSIGRLGGDEFVVLAEGVDEEAGPELVAERLLGVLREPFDLDDVTRGRLRLTASIGIATGTRPSAAELLRDADIALYEAKAAGKDCFAVFRHEMQTAVRDNQALEADLRDALLSRQYFLEYQPIFNLATGKTTGVEALLRWNHPTRGTVQPDAFIPVLEELGMIADVGRWVLEEACQQGARWHDVGYRLNVSVNVSARQLLTDQLIDDVRYAIGSSGFDAASLIIEITETAIMKDLEGVVPRLEALKTAGVRIAIDDFGTGYSSLAYLQQFPVDTLKIDRTFIAAMADSPESGALIRTLVQLGKTLGLETLAEGIEESEQYTQLEREQCDSGQGYLYARPLGVDAIEPFLAAQCATTNDH